MSFPKRLSQERPALGEWNILHCYRGSIAHGTYEPNTEPGSIDDKDTIGICVPPLPYYVGLPIGKGKGEWGGDDKCAGFSRGTLEIVDDPWDIVVYEARKAVKLLAKGNPNVLSMLWLPENLYISREPAGNLLVENRSLFAAKSTFYPFMGYARSQLVKMERGACEGYMGEKRRKLVKQHGFDTKNAAHLIRLLRMGIEFLSDGELQVQRHDAAELLAIKHGEWTLDRVKEQAEWLFRLAEEALVRSPLPERPDFPEIDRLTTEVVMSTLESRGDLA